MVLDYGHHIPGAMTQDLQDRLRCVTDLATEAVSADAFTGAVYIKGRANAAPF